MRKLPANLSSIPDLQWFSAKDTNLTSISELAGMYELRDVHLNGTRVTDLTPLANLPNLRLLYIHGTWVKDVSAVTTLPSLERLDIGRTQIATLQPVTRIGKLNWLNLHDSHALDGSQNHYLTIKNDRPFVDLAGGSAYQQNYMPNWQYNVFLQLNRIKETIGI